jgi:hypothetical protein
LYIIVPVIFDEELQKDVKEAPQTSAVIRNDLTAKEVEGF